LQLIPAVQQQVDPTSTGTNYFILSEFLSEFLSETPQKKLFHGGRVNLLGQVCVFLTWIYHPCDI
jgi:hypothetical protein